MSHPYLIMPDRGRLIVFEGLDRSGKSTQVQRLLERLHHDGVRARVQKFPDRTTAIGKMIDAYLQSREEMEDHAIHLLFSANRWECVAGIERDLAAGITVIADRYAFSGIAFSAAKGLSFDYCLNPERGLPLPDLTLFFTLTPEEAAKRGAYGEERYETVELQAKVRAQFDLVCRTVVQHHGPDRWTTIDAGGTMDEVQKRTWEAVSSCATKPRGCLWQASR